MTVALEIRYVTSEVKGMLGNTIYKKLLYWIMSDFYYM